MYRFLNGLVKATAFPAYWFCARTKVHYEDKKAQSRKIKGSAIIISNHTSVYDYALMLFLFFGRTLRYQMAEVLFKSKNLARFLKMMGGIFVDRDAYDFSFVSESIDILEKKGVVGIFPESRLPKPDEERPLPFKPSVTYIALESEAPIIPVYTNGVYFSKKRAQVIIGKPIYVRDLWDSALDEKQNIENITEALRQKIIDLGEELKKRSQKKNKNTAAENETTN
ncbi:MAG: 1-acyl-sn-glycerol-3-phosphate acyltransferase [Clostridiales bacterium]|nr:1-acyl-sn-glycerol-3-phosphate acyltransferase [Clostridiales bacterium]